MNLGLHILPCPDSPLRRLDPRWKLAGILIAVTLTACLRHLGPALFALTAALFLAALSRLPPRWFLTRLGAALLFLSPFVASLPILLRHRDASVPLGPLSVPYGLGVALLLTLKALAVITLMLVLLATAPLDATLKAGHALRIPGLLIQLGQL